MHSALDLLVFSTLQPTDMQQLGRHPAFGWFGRFGFVGSQASAGAKAEVGTGFAMQAPLKYAGWVAQLTGHASWR
jgi:hypothetical protein